MKPRFVEHLFVLIICASSLCLAADAGSEDTPGIRESPCVYQCRSRTMPTGLIAIAEPWRTVGRNVVHGFFQVLLAAEVSLGRQDGGVAQQELDLRQLPSIRVA